MYHLNVNGSRILLFILNVLTSLLEERIGSPLKLTLTLALYKTKAIVCLFSQQFIKAFCYEMKLEFKNYFRNVLAKL